MCREWREWHVQKGAMRGLKRLVAHLGHSMHGNMYTHSVVLHCVIHLVQIFVYTACQLARQQAEQQLKSNVMPLLHSSDQLLAVMGLRQMN